MDVGVDTASNGQRGVVLGSVLAAVGAFLPWVRIDFLDVSRTVTGIDGDGRFTLAFGVLAVLVLLFGNWRRRRAPLAAAVLGVLVFVLGTLYIVDPTTGVEASGGLGQPILDEAFSPAIGLYVTTLGGLLMTVGSAVALTD